MLEKHAYQEQLPDDDFGQFLTPSYLIEILKRRVFYFVVPFLLILGIGSIVTAAWPAQYLSRGTILVVSQEIPTDLVRPTVAALANDRIQIIEQRIMTRDNLLTLAKKFHLSAGWQDRLSGTEIVDFIKKRAQIKPLELQLQTQRKDAIAFTVGFEYGQPQIATSVANELVTMILNEDVRSRTEFATETTSFLDKEVKRLEAQLKLNDTQIAELTHRADGGGIYQSDPSADLAKLKTELLFKSATLSDTHPDILALKRKIEALKKLSTTTNTTADASQNAPATAANTPGLDALQTQRISLKEELNKTTQKLSAARLGENLERGQHSERLEVIEQPTMPTKPTSPNRPKIFGFVFALALMAGGGLMVAAEFLTQAVRRSTDLYTVVDSHLVVAIPYISTREELQNKKNTTLIATGIVAAVVLLGLIILFFFLPPMDILFDKVMTLLLR